LHYEIIRRERQGTTREHGHAEAIMLAATADIHFQPFELNPDMPARAPGHRSAEAVWRSLPYNLTESSIDHI
jgi:hypothetical protein